MGSEVEASSGTTRRNAANAEAADAARVAAPIAW